MNDTKKQILMAYLELTMQYNEGRICIQEFADKATELMNITLSIAIEHTVQAMLKEFQKAPKA